MSIYGSKTPVSIVHEYFVAIGITPSYELIVNQSGTHNPTFVYRVSAGEFFADGKGASKQQAKHNAAQLLIDVLKNRDMEAEGPADQLEDAIRTLSCPQDNFIGFNAVGALTEFCITKNYPAAQYDLIRDEGPPHARIFTVKCTVSNIAELGTARTKKQAKHHSAYAMIVRLKNMCGEEMNAVATVDSVDKPPPQKVQEKPPSPKKDFTKQDEEAAASYLKRTKSNRSAAKSSFIGDQYRSYVALLEKSPTVAQLAADDATEDIYKNNPLATLENIADELGMELETRVFGEGACKVCFVMLRLSPVLAYSAPTIDEAAFRAIRSILSVL